MSAANLKSYWEDRLAADWSLQGVGFRRLGRRFNEWAYRLRGERFDDIVARYVTDPADKHVLDVGSGTGFYIDRWLRNGAKSITGLDLTQAAVANLRQAFPDVSFICADVSDGIDAIENESIDVVSAMDVLFHITNDGRFADAVAEIARMLEPGGILIWSDVFIHGREKRLPHVTWRSLYRTETILQAAGLEVLERTPMFILMNEPHDAGSRTARKAWYGLMWACSQAEWLGALAGRTMYSIDRRLTRARTESPTTEIMICRRRSVS